MQEGYGDTYARRYALLFDNAAMMDSSTGLYDAMSLLARNMSASAGASSCIIMLSDDGVYYRVLVRHGTDAPHVERVELTGGAAEAADKKAPKMARARDIGIQQTDKYRHTDFLCIPMVSHGRTNGLAALFTPARCGGFTGDAIELTAMMAIQGSHAVDEFRYKEELAKKSDELRRVYDIQRRINRSIDLDEATDSIVENAPYITGLQYCLIYLLDPYQRNIVSVKAPEAVEKKYGKLTFSLDELVASKIAMEEHRPLFIEDAPNYKNIAQRIVTMLGWKSAIVLPLIARDRVLGVMWLYSTDRYLTFNENDRRSALALSDQAAVIIDNARIFKELEDSYEKLKDLDRTKMEFFTLISHELRNPLAVIKGFSELLYDGTLGPVNDKQREKLQRIRENVDRLTDIVGKMSDISSFESRRYAVDRSLFPLSDMVGELADTIRFLFTNKRITLEVNIPPGLPLVEADRKKIEQVLLNLLNNALKYTPDEGKVTITLKDRNSDVLVSVHDTGIGIPQKDLDKIFSGFYHSGYKLSYEYKGPGLGLAISRKIVEGHGGSIWARSEVGKGSTFYFTIPKHVGIPEEAKSSASGGQ
jgi:signal transduction histidine kinase